MNTSIEQLLPFFAVLAFILVALWIFSRIVVNVNVESETDLELEYLHLFTRVMMRYPNYHYPNLRNIKQLEWEDDHAVYWDIETYDWTKDYVYVFAVLNPKTRLFLKYQFRRKDDDVFTATGGQDSYTQNVKRQIQLLQHVLRYQKPTKPKLRIVK